MKAFDQPFSTGEATLRKEKAGVGVGLHLARQIVVEHGGVMWSDPLPGGGTRISFCIPIREGAATRRAPPRRRRLSVLTGRFERRGSPEAYPPLGGRTAGRRPSSG